MVYCPKCGDQNEDEASICSSCGAAIKLTRHSVWRREEEIKTHPQRLERRVERFGRQMEDECFGLPGGSSIVGIIFGLVLILVGVNELLGWNIDIGPFVIIIVGVLIVAGVLYKRSQDKNALT